MNTFTGQIPVREVLTGTLTGVSMVTVSMVTAEHSIKMKMFFFFVILLLDRKQSGPMIRCKPCVCVCI